MNATQPKLIGRSTISAAAAQQVIEAAKAAAAGASVPVSIAVLDSGGHLLAFLRMDGVHCGTIEVAVAKARSAFMFKRPTKAFAEAFQKAGPSLLALPNVLPFEGGLPIVSDGQVVGAVGISGGPPDVDGRICEAGIAAVS